MKRCDQCRVRTRNLYPVDPKTGKPSKTPLCRDCYERGFLQAWRDGNKLQLTRKTIADHQRNY
jgi:hypothetical protein